MLWLVALVAGCGQTPPPLVVIVVFDALRADRLTQYGHAGYESPISPGLERLVQRGTVFENAYAPASYTTASTASLFTGQLPVHHGSFRQGAVLQEELVTLTELAASRGYQTRGISFNPVIADSTQFTQGFDDFVEREKGSPFNLYPDIEQGLERMRAWLTETSRTPTYLYFQAMNTHGPYLVPRDQQAVLLGRNPLSDFRYYGQPMADILAGDLERRSEVTPRYLQSMNERYDTAVRYSTDRLGVFLHELEESGRFDDAMIVVTSDHGDELFEHGGFSHGYTLYEEVIRVPLIVKLPGQQGPSRVATRVSIMDIYPTVADVIGAEISHEIDGSSLVAMIKGEVDGQETAVDHSIPLLVEFSPRLRGRGVISGNHKYLRIDESYEGIQGGERLFDLASDPAERHDLLESRDAEALSIARALSEAQRMAARATGFPEAEVQTSLDAEHLRALGYAIPADSGD
jgi:arylsulfatase A-like enzyme